MFLNALKLLLAHCESVVFLGLGPPTAMLLIRSLIHNVSVPAMSVVPLTLSPQCAFRRCEVPTTKPMSDVRDSDCVPSCQASHACKRQSTFLWAPLHFMNMYVCAVTRHDLN